MTGMLAKWWQRFPHDPVKFPTHYHFKQECVRLLNSWDRPYKQLQIKPDCCEGWNANKTNISALNLTTDYVTEANISIADYFPNQIVSVSPETHSY